MKEKSDLHKGRHGTCMAMKIAGSTFVVAKETSLCGCENAIQRRLLHGCVGKDRLASSYDDVFGTESIGWTVINVGGVWRSGNALAEAQDLIALRDPDLDTWLSSRSGCLSWWGSWWKLWRYECLAGPFSLRLWHDYSWGSSVGWRGRLLKALRRASSGQQVRRCQRQRTGKWIMCLLGWWNVWRFGRCDTYVLADKTLDSMIFRFLHLILLW